MTENDIVQGLVALLQGKQRQVRDDADTLCYVLQGVMSVIDRYYPKESLIYILTNRLYSRADQLHRNGVAVNPNYQRCNVEDIARDTIGLIDMIVDEVKAVGLPERVGEGGVGAVDGNGQEGE